MNQCTKREAIELALECGCWKHEGDEMMCAEIDQLVRLINAVKTTSRNKALEDAALKCSEIKWLKRRSDDHVDMADWCSDAISEMIGKGTGK